MYFQCINGAKPMTGPSQINGPAAAPNSAPPTG